MLQIYIKIPNYIQTYNFYCRDAIHRIRKKKQGERIRFCSVSIGKFAAVVVWILSFLGWGCPAVLA